MRKKTNAESTPGTVQVFELTMDNAEDQDELNRRLRKPGEPAPCPSPSAKPNAQSESGEESTGKQKGRRMGTS
jgi:hypothetical protein